MEDCSIGQSAELCEYENQTLEAFVAARSLYAKFDCPVAPQNVSLLATAHDCGTILFLRIYGCQLYQISCFPSDDISKHCSWYKEKLLELA